MSIGIIGSGALGSNIARMLARSGIPATITNRRGPASLAPLVAEVGSSITAGTIEEAASADIVFVALRWVDLEKVLGRLPAWDGPNSADAKDPSNPLAAYGIKVVDLGGKHSSQVFRQLVPGARVVKAFNHLDVRVLSQPQVSGGRRVLFYSGDDAAAKADVRKIMDAAAFSPVDLGALDVGGPLASPPFGPLAAGSFVKLA